MTPVQTNRQTAARLAGFEPSKFNPGFAQLSRFLRVSSHLDVQTAPRQINGMATGVQTPSHTEGAA